MKYDVEFTDEFEVWWNGLDADEQEDIDACVHMLGERGPHLGYPHSSGIKSSCHNHMRELRIQHAGRPYRVLYAFDPRRVAVLLVGGSKVGDARWYDRHVPIADRLYDDHLVTLRSEGAI